MQIQVNTDSNIVGRDALQTHVGDVVKHALHRVHTHITRVEVYLSDENGNKSGQNDKRCVMEARLEGKKPVAVTHHAANLHQAIDGAAYKLIRLLDSNLGRAHAQKTRAKVPAGVDADAELVAAD
ncbi:HPF/RaiA family ribosome-associated protein [Uliginosibacterium sp. H3]|uniref:HPF/RaiA family ribosome-associated protein n=1 Tax=Uliginosibacterium silvisoli TaxID=3114758 RepID=A0ABU6K3R7_9RHOO|nr:HPF/RaiA family ribosome-associated protein [Uliginosibacterium sp. H3]